MSLRMEDVVSNLAIQDALGDFALNSIGVVQPPNIRQLNNPHLMLALIVSKSLPKNNQSVIFLKMVNVAQLIKELYVQLDIVQKLECVVLVKCLKLVIKKILMLVKHAVQRQKPEESLRKPLRRQLRRLKLQKHQSSRQRSLLRQKLQRPQLKKLRRLSNGLLHKNLRLLTLKMVLKHKSISKK